MKRFVAAEQGGSHLEWLSAIVLVLVLAFAFTFVGKQARHRIAGNGASDAIAADPSERVGLLPWNAHRNNDFDQRSATSPTNLQSPPELESDEPSATPIDPSIPLGCEEGFVNGAAQAFMTSDGEIIGDLVGVRDADIKAWLLDRPATQVLGDTRSAIANAAPRIVAAAPGVVTSATNAAIESVRANPTAAAQTTLNFLFIDPLRTAGQMTVDAWHGGGVLIAAAQSGDCVAFGRTLRNGVNNAPEFALSASDAMGLTSAGAALGMKAARSRRVVGLAQRVLSVAMHDVARAGDVALTVARTAARPRSMAALGTVVGRTARTATASSAAHGGLVANAALGTARALVSTATNGARWVVHDLRHGDPIGAARHAMASGRAALASLGEPAFATKAGTAPFREASDGMRRQATHFASRPLTGEQMLLAEAGGSGGIVPAGVCVGRRCTGRGGLCFVAGTRVHTQKGHVAIETLRVGDRVANTGAADANEESLVDTTWKALTLEMERARGDVVRVRLLRSPEWVGHANAIVGGTIRLSLPEMELDGRARVVAIDALPRVARGSGRIVLATFESKAKDVIELRFSGTNEMLEPTARHRLFSVDRGAWIAAGKLRIGERLRTRDGEAVIASIHPKRGVHTVYNIEVETDHSYFVGNVGVLSHNQEPYAAEPWARTITEARAAFPDLFPGVERASNRATGPFHMLYHDFALTWLAMDGRYDDVLRDSQVLFGKLDEGVRSARTRRRTLGTPRLDRLDEGMDTRLELFLGELVERRPEILVETGRARELAGMFLRDELTLGARIDDELMERLLSSREARPMINDLIRAQKQWAELARLKFLSGRGDVNAAAQYDLLARKTGGVEGTLTDHTMRSLAPLAESNIVARAMVNETEQVRRNTRIRNLVNEVIQWRSVADSPIPVDVVSLERTFRDRVARIAEMQEHIWRREGFSQQSFAHSMHGEEVSLIVETGATPNADMPWLLVKRDGQLYLRPQAPGSRPPRDAMRLENLHLNDEASIVAFMKFIRTNLDP